MSKNKEGKIVSKYTEGIMKKLRQHVSSYQLEVRPEDNKEEVARKEVQVHLANMMTHMPTIMNELTSNHFEFTVAKNKTLEKIRMYGEPCMPDEAFTAPVLKMLHAQHVSRRKTMFNLIIFDVPVKFFAKAMARDGSYLGESRLVVRPSNVNTYRVSVSKKSEVMEVTEATEVTVSEE